jgi:hypothetical protein
MSTQHPAAVLFPTSDELESADQESASLDAQIAFIDQALSALSGPQGSRPVALLSTIRRTHIVQLAWVDTADRFVRKDNISYVGTDLSAALNEQLRLRRLHECEARSVQEPKRDPEAAAQLARVLMLLVCVASLFGMSGCVSTSVDGPRAFEFATTEARNTQVALTGLMALDTAQTASFGNCFREANPLAVAVYGTDRPSPKQVLITNTVYIAAHWAAASYLDRKAEAPIDLSLTAEQDMARRGRWRFMRGLYQFLTAFGHGAAVINNQLEGIRPFSTPKCGAQS